MSGHTPGPWKWIGPYSEEVIAPNVVTLGDDGGCDDPECCGDASYHITISEANAALIAAAPDLLEACIAAITTFHDAPELTDILVAAIDKARGKE